MVKGDAWFGILLQSCCITDLASTKRPSNLLRKCLVIPEFVEDGFMEEVLNVFGVVEGCRGRGCLGGFLLVPRFAGIDSLVNAETAEVWEGDLELADGLGSGDKILGLARGAYNPLSIEYMRTVIRDSPFFLILPIVVRQRFVRKPEGRISEQGKIKIIAAVSEL